MRSFLELKLNFVGGIPERDRTFLVLRKLVPDSLTRHFPLGVNPVLGQFLNWFDSIRSLFLNYLAHDIACQD